LAHSSPAAVFAIPHPSLFSPRSSKPGKLVHVTSSDL
jgi:hypothetical protein